MAPSGAGSHSRRDAVWASKAISWALDGPPVAATYTVGPFTASATGVPSSSGAHAASTERSDRTCARLARSVSPTCRNAPPTNQPPEPSGATELTDPSIAGHVVSRPPVAASRTTQPPAAGPTTPNVPSTNTEPAGPGASP